MNAQESEIRLRIATGLSERRTQGSFSITLHLTRPDPPPHGPIWLLSCQLPWPPAARTLEEAHLRLPLRVEDVVKPRGVTVRSDSKTGTSFYYEPAAEDPSDLTIKIEFTSPNTFR